MTILSIETSCDETAVSLVKAGGDFPNGSYQLLGNALFSQVDLHKEYGGVFPTVAKREHIKTLIPITVRALKEASLYENDTVELSNEQIGGLHALLTHEEGFAEALTTFFSETKRPDVDYIAVTAGPGLEPTLWVGINFAKALSLVWDMPVIDVNHMEGHVLASVFDEHALKPIAFPAISLLVSGGHTELILSKEWGHYERIGETRDDAVGEAFDKVARLLGLPYPGGPEVSKKASEGRERNISYSDYFDKPLPRPMLNSNDLDFSFSGLKTAVRYAIQDVSMTEEHVMAVAREFEDAAVEVLTEKTKHAALTHGAQTIIVGGGVSANRHLRDEMQRNLSQDVDEQSIYFPGKGLSTDNSVMIALAAHAHIDRAHSPEAALTAIRANGNRSITEESIS